MNHFIFNQALFDDVELKIEGTQDVDQMQLCAFLGVKINYM